jgi:hypothetical protein
VPALVQASIDHCPKSSLPFTSIDLWYHHADVSQTRHRTRFIITPSVLLNVPQRILQTRL